MSAQVSGTAGVAPGTSEVSLAGRQAGRGNLATRHHDILIWGAPFS